MQVGLPRRGVYSLPHRLAGAYRVGRDLLTPMQWQKVGGALVAYGANAYQRYRNNKSNPSALVPLRQPRILAKYPYKAIMPKAGKKKTVKSRVKAIERQLREEEGNLFYRKIASARQVIATASTQSSGHYSSNYTTSIEAALAQMRFYNPATPGTLTTSDLTSGTNSKAARVSAKGYILLANNYQVPVVATLYCIAPKTDHSINSTSAIDGGLADSSAGPLTSTSITVKPSDSLQFRDLWKVLKKKTVVLKPGKTLRMSYSTKEFMYDPSYVDSQTASYQPRNQSRSWLVMLKGVLGHDISDTTQQAFMVGGVDIVNYTQLHVRYNAGIKMTYFVEESSGLDTAFTNSGVVSEQPVADNIAYSVS